MKLTKIDWRYLPATIIRDMMNPVYVEFRESELGLIKQDKILDRVCWSTAIVANDPYLGPNYYRVIGLDGKLAWSKAYKTIRAAIRNAIYA